MALLGSQVLTKEDSFVRLFVVCLEKKEVKKKQKKRDLNTRHTTTCQVFGG